MSETPTIITLTLPPSDRLDGEGTLLIQRGTLAHLTQFTYIGVQDITAVIQSAYVALAAVENDPPVIPDTPSPTTLPKTIKPIKSAEPMLTIPIGKKTLDIPARNLQLAQPDQQPLALQITSKLISGKLWDWQSPIFIADVHQTFKKLKHLDEKSLAMFALEDFVQIGTVETVDEDTDSTNDDVRASGLADDEAETSLSVGETVSLVAGATDTDGDPVAFSTGRIVEVDESEQPARVWIESLDGEYDVWVSWDHIQPLTTALCILSS